MSSKRLLEPFALGPLQLPNRMVMAPLTRCRALEGDVPGPLAVQYYRQRASAGLIISEGSQVSPQGKGYMRTPGIHSAAQVAGWQDVTSAVHEAGGRIFLQLWHVGRLSHPLFQPGGAAPVAPSAIAPAGKLFTPEGEQPYPVPRALERDEIPQVVEQFAHAARKAKEAGFDGVEIHGANGYLIDQFLRDGTNQRTDDYGGSLSNRSRLLCEIVEAVAAEFGEERVGVRISPVFTNFSMSDSNPEATFRHVVERLNAYRLAYLHVVTLGTPGFDFTALRRLWKGVFILCGGFDPQTAEAALVNDEADLVAFGKAFLANPDLVERAHLGAPLNEPDKATFYQGEARGYTDYPTLAELES